MRQNRSLAQAFTPGSARYSLLSPSAGARLFSLPAHTVFRVLKNNSTLGQLITNFICTIEVAAISRNISRALRLNEDLAETIALAHDLGHSPFGHKGETVLARLMKGCDTVFHLAANANGTYSVEHPGEDFRTNCVGTFNVLQAALEAGVRRVVYVSSASVYGTPRRFPIPESHPTDPIVPYGASKVAGERFGLAFLNSYGLDFVAARPFCVYGPGEDPATSLVEVSRYLRWHLNGRAIQVVGDARRKTRDFIHVTDAVQGLVAIAERAHPGEILNVGSGTEVSMRELAEHIERLAGGTVRVRELTDIQDDTYRLVADISRLRRLGFVPRVPLDEGLAGLIENLGDRPELPERCHDLPTGPEGGGVIEVRDAPASRKPDRCPAVRDLAMATRLARNRP